MSDLVTYIYGHVNCLCHQTECVLTLCINHGKWLLGIAWSKSECILRTGTNVYGYLSIRNFLQRKDIWDWNQIALNWNWLKLKCNKIIENKVTVGCTNEGPEVMGIMVSSGET